MTINLHLISLLVGIVFSILLPIVTCFHRKRVYALWARLASLLACIAGLGWGFIGLVADTDYPRTEGIRGLLGGICIGLVVSILISKPYEKRVA